ncbi:MAG TPA: CHASE sensor domain-containing protein, partial [Rheinheimera sp.]|nr:CHASE sensor domain-containing protein [Rheinheimera sp.]
MRHLSFHQKVFLAILLTSVLVLTIVIVPLFWNSSAQYKQQLEIQTAAQSRMLASMNTASVMFDQPEAATSMLSALKEQPDITSAHLYKLDGSTHQLSLFAAYGEPIEIDLTTMPEPGASFSEQQLRYTEPLLLDDSVIGYLLLDVSMQGLAAKMAKLRWTLAGALFFAIIIASWLALVASRSALKPLQDLKDVTSSIATTKDYSRRAELLYDADLSDVIRSFNTMLDVIEQKNQQQQVKEQEVLELNKTLEQKVIERTSELQKSVTEL